MWVAGATVPIKEDLKNYPTLEAGFNDFLYDLRAT